MPLSEQELLTALKMRARLERVRRTIIETLPRIDRLVRATAIVSTPEGQMTTLSFVPQPEGFSGPEVGVASAFEFELSAGIQSDLKALLAQALFTEEASLIASLEALGVDTKTASSVVPPEPEPEPEPGPDPAPETPPEGEF